MLSAVVVAVAVAAAAVGVVVVAVAMLSSSAHTDRFMASFAVADGSLNYARLWKCNDSFVFLIQVHLESHTCLFEV